ncbi:MAG: hypothetical protein SFX18_00230 [Pirellulales bacterium]|nr:hypothetical protein [Pirellulales bacterium]
MRSIFILVILTTVSLAGWGVCGTASAAYLGPTPYLGFADSPFAGQPFQYFHLETFDDGALNTPGVAANPGWIIATAGALTDSVDANGQSYYSGQTQSSLTLTFDAASLGGLFPTAVGIVWTDVGNLVSGGLGVGDVTFSAVDGMGAPLGAFGPFTLGDGTALSNSAEDRFLGVTSATGVSSITISMPNSIDWEVDHLQYGAIPEPGLGWLLVGGALMCGGWQLRRMTAC